MTYVWHVYKFVLKASVGFLVACNEQDEIHWKVFTRFINSKLYYLCYWKHT
ncbi:hypothetical protein KFK09_028863 [Dendrobium nobile]|uniref:Uncharacterized protein n=1 Tax=Dendrobium nobile TaxID=94219 RepID=A0A8T3A4E4_DENNO|nr:hypothetical protein KFK09_028863 [Dendrobium nobile]